MKFLLSGDSEACIEAVYSRLHAELDSGKRVLWMVPGGSNITAVVRIMDLLARSNTENLTVTLTDERYGNYGHADSNWQHLQAAGFNRQQARLLPVLQSDNQSRDQTATIWESNLRVALDEAQTVIGFYGLGDDGHLSGILPGSEAVAAQDLVADYTSDPYERITTTFAMIRRCDVAFACALGPAKAAMLDRLAGNQASLSEQPAQVLKELPEAYIFNDHRGD